MDPLATIGELEAHLQRTVDAASANLALALASGAVRAYCGWDLAAEETTLLAYGDDTPILTLPTLHLLDVTAIRIDGAEVDLSIPVTDGRPSWSRKGQIFRAAGWPRFAEVEVDLVHGYDVIPDLIKLVTLDVAAVSIVNPENLVSAVTGHVSRTWARPGDDNRLTALHQRLLERFRL